MQQTDNEQLEAAQAEQPSTGKRPVETLRSGAIGASIWEEKASDGRTYHTISLSRAWKSQQDETKSGYSQSFFARNRQDLVNVIHQACDAVERREKDDGSTSGETH